MFDHSTPTQEIVEYLQYWADPKHATKNHKPTFKDRLNAAFELNLRLPFIMSLNDCRALSYNLATGPLHYDENTGVLSWEEGNGELDSAQCDPFGVELGGMK